MNIKIYIVWIKYFEKYFKKSFKSLNSERKNYISNWMFRNLYF